MNADFTHTTLRAVNKRVHRLGLACSFGLDAKAFEAALERGLNYIYWTRFRTGQVLPALKAALQRNREAYVVVGTPTFGYFGSSVRKGCEKTLRTLGIDHLDVFQLGWLGTASAYTPATIDALLELKREGKVRAIGTSIHDRPRAGRLAEDSPLDLFMLRYNAAHPGAERDVFPHLAKRQPSVVAYTATNWRRLLRAPKGWTGPTMTAGDCYPLLPVEPARRGGAQRPSEPRAARAEPGGGREGPAGSRRAEVDARVRTARARLALAQAEAHFSAA
jgi:aryl-alcohol dehydrogenase-like predicted oxidoreductase